MDNNLTVYFANRSMDILGVASTHLPDTLRLESDKIVEVLDGGSSYFESTVSYLGKSKNKIESEFVKVGNYILLQDRFGKSKVFTIIESEKDREKNEIYSYAEDASLDLLNEVVQPFESAKNMYIADYFKKYLANSGYKIGINELGKDYSRKLKWEGSATVTERLLSIATQFDHAEISFSFEIKGMKVKEKYINIFKKRGTDTGTTLQLNRDVNNIITTESIKNLGTSLYSTGSVPEGKDLPITLKGYKPPNPDARFKIEGEFLRDVESNQRWSRFLAEGADFKGGYITKEFSYETLSQSELYNRSVNRLKLISQVEQNFEVDIAVLPDNVRVGDKVRIVDQDDKLYLEARVLTLETSYSFDESKAVLGDFLIKEDGFNDKLKELAEKIASLPRGATDYMWLRYADDDKGNGFSASPANKAYMAIRHELNKPVPSDNPDDYQGLWVKFMGPTGESIEGPPGKDGQQKWTWMRYADNVSGGGISAESEGKMYIGFAYNKDTATPSNNPKDYAWFLAKGEDGADGKNGLSITSVQSLFYQSTSATSLVGGTWVTTAPVWASGKYSWTKTKTVFSDSTSSETVPVNITGGIGEDGKPTYSWLMYAEDDKGKGISASPSGKYYMGLAHNKPVEKPSTVPADYKWSAMYDEEKMAELQEQLNNIQIGGTNLIRDSAFDEGRKHFPVFYDNVFSVDSAKKFMNQNTLKFQWVQGVGDFPAVVTDYMEVREAGMIGKDMTMSIYVFIPEDAVMNADAYVEVAGYENTSQANNTTLAGARIEVPANMKKGEWTRFVTTFKVPETSGNGKVNYTRFLMRHRAKTGTDKAKFYYALPQLEFGNKVSDWNRNPADTPTTGDLSNVQTELQNRLDTIVMPVTQPNTPENPKEGMIWWQDDLKGDIIGMFKYEKGKWEPQTIQQSMLNIIELNAIRITGSTITGSDIFGAKFTNNFKYKQNEGTPIEWTVSGITDIEGKITMDWFVEGADDNGRMVISPEGIYGSYYSDTARNKMTGYWNLHSNGFEMSTGNRATNNFKSANYYSSGIMMTDQTKKFGDVNLKYSDLLSLANF